MLRCEFCLTTAILFLGAVNCLAADRTLRFPDDRNCGTLSICPPPTESEFISGFHDFGQPSKSLGKARGTIVVSDSDFIELSLNGEETNDLGFLKKLPERSIEGMKITKAKLRTVDFERIAGLTGLRHLYLYDCSFEEPSGISEVIALPHLEWMMFSISGSEMDRSALMRWVSKCPKLRYLYDRDREFSLESIRLFKGHPERLFLQAKLGSNAMEVISALQQIPRLQALNLTIGADATDGYWKELPKLKNVELINWNGGEIDAAILKSIGGCPKLRTLRLQGGIKIKSDFPSGLPFCANLEEVGINPQSIEYTPAELHKGLCGMERLKRWPRIENADAVTLNHMGEVANLERIAISGLGKDCSIEQIERILRKKTLRAIDLSDIPFSPQISGAISGCENLEFLRLTVDTFDGQYLNPAKLTKLDQLSLEVAGEATNLSELAKLESLSQLDLDLSSQSTEQYEFIRHAKSLKSLDLQTGFVDDQVASWIVENGGITGFRTLQNCVMTDAGVGKLAACKSLQRLSIGGFITRDAVKSLLRLPELLSLHLCSDLLSSEDRNELKNSFKSLERVSFSDMQTTFGKIVVGIDGIWRNREPAWQDSMDSLEGSDLRAMFWESLNDAELKKYEEKVVLVDFWGTWCGPCLALEPELIRMQQKLGRQGFHVLAIHSTRGDVNLDDYLKRKPKPWQNIRDENSVLEQRFHVPNWPSLYLFDRNGKLQAAKVHRLNLESSVKKLLDRN